MKNYINIISKSIEYLVALTLLIICVLSVKGVWNKYQTNDTSIKVSTKSSKTLPMPTITICFMPIAKLSVLKKYNVSLKHFRYEYSDGIEEGLSWPDVYFEASYKIGIDFNISLGIKDYQDYITIQSTDLSANQAKYIDFKMIHSLWKGLCYQISYKYEAEYSWSSEVSLDFDKSLSDQDMPKIEVIFTSYNNSYGIIDIDWVEGDKYNLLIDLRKMMTYSINFKTFEYVILKDVKHCLEGSFYECRSLG